MSAWKLLPRIRAYQGLDSLDFFGGDYLLQVNLHTRIEVGGITYQNNHASRMRSCHTVDYGVVPISSELHKTFQPFPLMVFYIIEKLNYARLGCFIEGIEASCAKRCAAGSALHTRHFGTSLRTIMPTGFFISSLRRSR
jgi:hypothetical protein